MGLFEFFYLGSSKQKDREEPEKRRFFLFFELYFRKFGKLCQLNLLFLLFCLPVVTIGPALAGRTLILRNFSRQEPVFLWHDFKDAVFKNFRQTFPAGLLQLFVWIGMVTNMYFMLYADMGTAGTVFIAFSGAFLAFFSIMYYYVYLMIVTFELSFKDVFKNSAIFVIANLLPNLAAFFASLAVYAVAFVCYYYGLEVNSGTPAINVGLLFVLTLLFAFVLFSLVGFIQQFSVYYRFEEFMLKRNRS